MTAHERPVGATVEWYTPPELFEKLGLGFDLDPASPAAHAVPWVPAIRFYSPREDGLVMPWKGRVWLNPPYGPSLPRFVDRMIEHDNGLMLTAARTETRWWQKAAESARLICFLRDRLHFIRDDGLQARSSHASTLFVFGNECIPAVVRANLGYYAEPLHPLLKRLQEAA